MKITYLAKTFLYYYIFNRSGSGFGKWAQHFYKLSDMLIIIVVFKDSAFDVNGPSVKPTRKYESH
jgi:hypothetical protein